MEVAGEGNGDGGGGGIDVQHHVRVVDDVGKPEVVGSVHPAEGKAVHHLAEGGAGARQRWQACMGRQGRPRAGAATDEQVGLVFGQSVNERVKNGILPGDAEAGSVIQRAADKAASNVARTHLIARKEGDAPAEAGVAAAFCRSGLWHAAMP